METKKTIGAKLPLNCTAYLKKIRHMTSNELHDAAVEWDVGISEEASDDEICKALELEVTNFYSDMAGYCALEKAVLEYTKDTKLPNSPELYAKVLSHCDAYADIYLNSLRDSEIKSKIKAHGIVVPKQISRHKLINFALVLEQADFIAELNTMSTAVKHE